MRDPLEAFGRELPDGRYASLTSLTYGRARLVVSASREDARYGYDDGW